MHARHKVIWLLSVALLVFAGTLVLMNRRGLIAERDLATRTLATKVRVALLDLS